MTAQIKYFIYTRKSTEEEERQALSIPAQISELKQYAEKENLQIVDIFTESKSAKKPGRKIFNELLKNIEAGEAQGILSWHPDRLARNSVDGGKIIHLLDEGKLLDLKFPTFWFQNTPQGIFMLNIAFGQSKYYVDNLTENTKRGLREKIRRGIYPAFAPKGYLNDLKNKTIIVDTKEAPIIKKAFKLYVKGVYGFDDIGKFLFSKGIKTKNDNPLHKDRIKRILSNPFYYGHFRYAGEIYEGIHKPLISKKLFDQVQEVLKKRGRPQRKEKIPKAFTQLMRCGECGMSITGEIQTKFYKGTNRHAIYIYYRCTKKHRTKKCLQPYTREKAIISQLNKIIQKVSLPQSWGIKMLKKIDEEKKQEKGKIQEVIQGSQIQLDSLKNRLERLLDAHLDQAISREEYLEKKEKLMNKKKDLEEKTIDLEKSGITWLEPFKEWVKVAVLASKIAGDDKDLHQKRSFLQKTGSNLVLKDKKVRCFFKKPWAFLAERPTSRNWVGSVRLERTTFSMSTKRSNQLSYEP